LEVDSGIKFFAIDDVTLISDGKWTKSPAPVDSYPGRMAYDQKLHEMVLFNGETWTWDGLKWTHRNPTKSPSGFDVVTTYDSVRGVVVLFDGTETWTWDGKKWCYLEAYISSRLG
jgi:hypothetical protein